MASLARILEQIYAARIPLSEQRFLASRAIAQIGHATQSEHSLLALAHMEEVLAAVGKKSGKGKVNVTQAKQWLRGFGKVGVGLASRLSRLSKSRNSEAHLVVGLVGDIFELPDSDGLIGKDTLHGHDKVPKYLVKQASSEASEGSTTGGSDVVDVVREGTERFDIFSEAGEGEAVANGAGSAKVAVGAKARESLPVPNNTVIVDMAKGASGIRGGERSKDPDEPMVALKEILEDLLKATEQAEAKAKARRRRDW
jgi:hypothetical protein